MGKGVVLLSEEKNNLKEVVGFPRLLANKLNEGQAFLQQGGRIIITKRTGLCVLEIKAGEELKKGAVKRSLELEFEWREADQSVGAIILGQRPTMISGIAPGPGSY
ncbi:MAG: hypothetical protein BMS9Abin02_0562 [Anaerolineae bacterium]|nr:MAG: hypothetical protein BMS9Abin02_0562 [Anaerolineae bacterium]